jgi:type I restriction enzyme S subunit
VSNVPDGWVEAALGDVAETALGKMLDRGRTRGLAQVPYLRNVNVQWGRIDTDDLLSMELADDERDRFEVVAGDLLVCEGGEVGRCAIWPGSNSYIAYQKALHRIRPSPKVDSKYLRYLLEYQSQTGVLASHSTGSTIKHLPQQQLRRIPVPLPPLEEQRRIISALEKLISHLDVAYAQLGFAERRLGRFRESWLAVQKEWVGASARVLGTLLESPLRHGRSVATSASGFPVLRLTAIRNGRIDLQERKTGAWTAAQAQPFLVRDGDFLIARGSGSLALVGRGGLIRGRPDPVAYPDTAIRVRPNRSLLDPEFLSLIWETPEIRRQIESAARTTAGIHKINQADLRSVTLRLPSIANQRIIASRAADMGDARLRLESSIIRASERAMTLRRSLLKAAFSGCLAELGTEAKRSEEPTGV